MPAPNRRIVLLGKSGVGKSSLANTILKEPLFGEKCSAASETSKCKTETREVDGRSITLTDTPGFFDNNMSKRDLKSEIVKCITDCSPGPHVFLIVLKVERFTDQEKQVISKIKKSFSEEAFKYSVVVFTHGDQLDVNMKIEDFVGENKKLRELLEKCGNRYHVIDNKYWKDKVNGYRSNKVQMEALLNTIDRMVRENKETYYTNKLFQFVERRIREEEINIRQTRGNMSDQDIREQAERKVRGDIMKEIAGVSIGVLLGALLGVPLMVSLVLKALIKLGPVVAAAGRTVVEAAQAVGGVKAAVGAVGAAAVGGGVGGGVGAAAAAAGAAEAGGAVGAGAAAVGGAEAAAGAAGAAGAALTAESAAFIGAGVGVGIITVAGAVIGGRTGYEEARKADSAKEAMKNTAGAIGRKIAEPFKEIKGKVQNNQEDEEPLTQRMSQLRLMNDC